MICLAIGIVMLSRPLRADGASPIDDVVSQFDIIDFEGEELRDKDWMLKQEDGFTGVFLEPKRDSGGDVLSLAVGEGRNGGNALLVQSSDQQMGLPGFWLKKGVKKRGFVGQSNGDDGYFLPRGIRANRLEFWVRFDDGFREKYAARADIHRTIDVGTYHYNPAKKSNRVVESNNWHFYYNFVIRHDRANGNWIHVVLNQVPQDQRSSAALVPLNPTSPNGNFWELLTRLYIDCTPYFQDPEIPYPVRMFVDDIRLSYVEPSDVTVVIENCVPGQMVNLPADKPVWLQATIQNASHSKVAGEIQLRGDRQLKVELLDFDTSRPITGQLSLRPGEARQVSLRVSLKKKMKPGRTFYVGLLFVPATGEMPDPYLELRPIYGNSGALDMSNSGAFVRLEFQGSRANTDVDVLGGISIRTTAGVPVDGLLVAADRNGRQLRFSILNEPPAGTRLKLDALSGSFQFDPGEKFTGVWRFRFRASNGLHDSSARIGWIRVDPKK